MVELATPSIMGLPPTKLVHLFLAHTQRILQTQASNEKILSLNSSIQSISSDIESFQENKFKKAFITLGLMILISASTAAGASYFMLSKFPQTVRIDHTGVINVEQGRVFVEGKSIFNTDKDTKIIKK
jgi:uncharacterized membrane-anchored protein